MVNKSVLFQKQIKTTKYLAESKKSSTFAGLKNVKQEKCEIYVW